MTLLSIWVTERFKDMFVRILMTTDEPSTHLRRSRQLLLILLCQKALQIKTCSALIIE